MEYDNWKMSDDKWNPETGVLNELNKLGRINWERVLWLLEKPCGHCRAFSCRTGCCALLSSDKIC
jgi:hypothetical protein